MGKPQPGEWLYEHEEEGQTFDAYKGQMHNVVDQQRNTIYIKPLESMDEGFLKHLKAYCECFFHPMKIKVGKKLSLPNRLLKGSTPTLKNCSSTAGSTWWGGSSKTPPA